MTKILYGILTCLIFFSLQTASAESFKTTIKNLGKKYPFEREEIYHTALNIMVASKHIYDNNRQYNASDQQMEICHMMAKTFAEAIIGLEEGYLSENEFAFTIMDLRAKYGTLNDCVNIIHNTGYSINDLN